MLYLESTTVRDAFSTERTEVPRLLCTQVAIAMENARLYARLRGASAKLHEANSRLRSDVALRTAERTRPISICSIAANSSMR